MTFARSETFRSIGQILAVDVLPALYRAQKLPLRISCLGVASYDASDAANSFDRVIPLGECPSPEEAIQAAALRLSRGDICTGPDSFRIFSCASCSFRTEISAWSSPVKSAPTLSSGNSPSHPMPKHAGS
ncbi:hypothetical protein SAMN02927924_03206 [Sphingobium faniae]|nr:hypothetical protein [Mesorhizobium sp. ES1-1]SCW83052.1 hypothetical protein SAMN02927924_03206 [Sphingobium faniae]